MPTLRLRALERENPNVGFTRNMDFSLKITGDLPDGPVTLTHRLAQQKRFTIPEDRREIRFGEEARVMLKVEKATFPTRSIPGIAQHRDRIEFRPEKGPRFILWYEVIPDGDTAETFHDIPAAFTLRDMLGRLGRGTRDQDFGEAIADHLIYRGTEMIDVRALVRLHREQDGRQAGRLSLRAWLRDHSNCWGEQSVIPIAETPTGPKKLSLLFSAPNWKSVISERSRMLAGIQWDSFLTNEDNPSTHRSLDWLFNIFPSPSFQYLLAYTAKRRSFAKAHGGEKPLASQQVPYCHNEWESSGFAHDWRPFKGEYVTVWGRHVFDLGHMPISAEMHPAHTILRERTTGARLTTNGPMLPVNRMIIGMGSSGGFPGLWSTTREHLRGRWELEFGALPEDQRSRSCWATNLTKHGFRVPIFPPGKRPAGATLQARVAFCEIIAIDSALPAKQFRRRLRDFLKLELTWDRDDEWRPVKAPASLKPKIKLRGDHAEITVDLASARDFPVAYFAMVDCGWNLRGNARLQKYEIHFVSVTARRLHAKERSEEWRLHVGCNGVRWFVSLNGVRKGETIDVDKKVTVWTVDDLPLSIQINGIERDKTLWTNEKLDDIDLLFPGVDHLQAIRDAGISGLAITRDDPNRIDLDVDSESDQRWRLSIRRRESSD